MSRPEGKPVSITVKRPSLDDLKRMYGAAISDPNRWLTFLWEDLKGRRAFDAVNPYRESRGPQRENILKALSPEPGDEGNLLQAEIIIYDMSEDKVATKKTAGKKRKKRPPIPAVFQKTIEELDLNNL